MELVAYAADLATLLQISRQAGYPNPFVTAIPADCHKRDVVVLGAGQAVAPYVVRDWLGKAAK